MYRPKPEEQDFWEQCAISFMNALISNYPSCNPKTAFDYADKLTQERRKRLYRDTLFVEEPSEKISDIPDVVHDGVVLDDEPQGNPFLTKEEQK